MRVFRIVLTFCAWSSVALAQPIEVASGADLAAWRSLEQQRLEGPAAVTAYQRYVLSYSASPLAVMAWTRLVALDGTDGDWLQVTATRNVVAQVRKMWEDHQRILANERSSVRVEHVSTFETPALDGALQVTSR